MPVVPLNAVMQQQVLTYLNGQSISSVAELARRLEAHRPSVSRALHLLADANLVIHEGRTWSITDDGRDAVQRVHQQKNEMFQVVKRRSTKLLQATLTPALAALEAESQAGTDRKTSPAAKELIERLHQDAIHQLESPAAQSFLQNPGFQANARSAQAALDVAQPLLPRPSLLNESLRSLVGKLAPQINLLGTIQASASPIHPRTVSHISEMLAHADTGAGSRLSEALSQSNIEAAGQIAEMLGHANTEIAEHMAGMLSNFDLANQQMHWLTQISLFQTAPYQPFPLDIGTTLLFRETLASVTQAQTASLGLLRTSLVPGLFEDLHLSHLTVLNAAIGQMAVDLEQIGRISPSTALLGDLFRSSAEAGRAYSANFVQLIQAQTDRHNQYRAHASSDLRFLLELEGSTTTTALLIGATRSVALSEQHDTAGDVVTLRPYEALINDQRRIEHIGIQLGRIAPRFMERWESAWLSLRIDEPYQFSAASNSARELLRQFLEHLAPDSLFTDEECQQYGRLLLGRKDGKKVPTQAMRVRRILELPLDASPGWLDQILKLVHDLYEQTNELTHWSKDSSPNSEPHLAEALLGLGQLLCQLAGLPPFPSHD